MKERVMEILERAISEINAMREESVKFSNDLHLIGSKGCFDSLALVSFVATVEDLIADEYGKEVWLVNEKAFSKDNSPFYTVETLSNYIVSVIEEGK